MKIRLKRLEDQVMVITGASSGIGLVTARMASKRGARLVLAARSEGSLGELAREIEGRGGKAVAVVADVANRDDVRKVAQAAEDTFGGFDTWVNNAGVSIYGKTTDVPVEDMRRLFETNFWGVVNGSLEAVEHLRERGGALINLGSTLGDRTSVLQGPYSASKHAVKGFTDGLRMDLDLEKAPISVSLVKPGPIDTPYPLNAKNYLDRENKHPAPTYAPDLVAEAILRCAEVPTRDITIGGAGRLVASMGVLAPRLTDWLMEAVFVPQQKFDRPPRPRDQNALFEPSERLAERGNYPGHTRETSLYTAAELHPAVLGVAAAGAGLALATLLMRGARDRA